LTYKAPAATRCWVDVIDDVEASDLQPYPLWRLSRHCYEDWGRMCRAPGLLSVESAWVSVFGVSARYVDM
jgi:hypothetical protein